MEELCSILLYEVWAINVIQFKIQFSSHRYRPEWRSCLYQCALIPTTGRLASLRCVGRWLDRLWSSRYNCTFTTEYKQQCIRPGKQNTMAGNNVLHQENKTWRSRYIFLSTIMRWEDKEGKRGRRWVTHWNKQAGRRRWVCSWSLTRPSCCCNPGRR